MTHLSMLKSIFFYAPYFALSYACYSTTVYLCKIFFKKSTSEAVVTIKEFLRKNSTLASLFTLCRLFLTFPIYHTIGLQDWQCAFLYTAFAGFTDLMDGFIARRLNQVTIFGAFLDAFVDKVLISTMMWALLGIKLPPLFKALVGFIFIKEIVQLCGSVYLFFKGRLKTVKPLFLGKISMFAQLMFALLLMAKSCSYGLVVSALIVVPLFLLLFASMISYTILFMKINQLEFD